MSRCATPPTTPSPLPFHCPSPLPTFRNLGPDQLAGVIFTCTEDSLDDCLRAGVFGLPRTHFQYVQHVRPSMVLFLFNFSTRDLHGIFRAMTGGKIDGEPQGVNPEWAANFPAQVDVDTSDTYPPLPESAFRRIISENYISSTSSQFSFELDMDQVARLSAAFKQFSINRSTPTPQNPMPQFNLPNPPPMPLLGAAAGAAISGGGDLKPTTPWPNEKTRRLSPVPRHPIRDLFIPGRPKSSMDYLSGHAPPYDVDFSLFGGGGGGSRLDSNHQMNNPPPQLQGSGLSLDPNVFQMNQLPNLLGVNPGPPPLLNQLDLQTVQALQKVRLRSESPWGGLDPNDSVLPVAGMMGQLNPQETASSQLLNQTQMGLGLNPVPSNQGGIRGRFSTGNLSPVDPIDPFANDPAINPLKLTEQHNLDLQISQAINILNPEEKQQSKIWKVSPKDKGLVTDPTKVYAEAFKFPEKSAVLGLESTGLQTQRFSGSFAEGGQEGITGRYQETWGGPNPATWKPPRPHSSAEGELDPFSRNTIPGLSTMYPADLKPQVVVQGGEGGGGGIPDELEFIRPKSVSRASVGKPGLKTKSRNNDETAILSDGGTPSEDGAAESPPKEQVNIKALEDESIAINQYENVGGGYPTNDLFLDKTASDKNPVFGFTPGDYYPTGEELVTKRNNISLVNALNGGPGTGGQNLMTMQSSNIGPGADFNDLLQPTGLDLGISGTTGGGGVNNTGRLESEMMSRLVLENERLRTECNQLQKQITSVKNKKPLDYATIHTTSSDVKTVTEMVFLGGLLDTNIVKVINPELPEQMKRIEIGFNFCRGAGVNIGSHVFLMGGTSLETPNKLMTGLYRLDPLSSGDEGLKSLAPMKQGRCLFGSVTSGMKIFAIGGLTEQGPTNTVEIYDPILDSWMPGPCLNHAKHSLGTAVVNSIIYSVGGQSEKGALQTVEMLDPREGKWIQIGSLSWSRSGLACCPVFNHLFAVGGQNGRSVLSSGEILDLRKGIVNESLTMIEPRQYGVAVPIENSVYLIGGLQTLESDNNSKFSKPEVFNTMLSTSSLVSSIPEDQLSMVFHCACAIPHCLY